MLANQYRLKRRARMRNVGNLPGSLTIVVDPTGPASEAYRALGANLMYILMDASSKVVVVTSPNPLEGKSTTCANLGVVLAQADKSTLVVDCDFRSPTMHKIFGLQNLRGAIDVLGEECSLQEACHRTVQQGLQLLPAGPVPPNPAELLSSERFSRFLDEVRREFDYVVVDVPPTSLVADPLLVANQGDGVLLIVDPQITPEESVRQAMRSLAIAGAKVLGTVVNNAKIPNRSRYSYAYR